MLTSSISFSQFLSPSQEEVGEPERNLDEDTGIISQDAAINLLSLVLMGIKMKDQERIQAHQQSLEQLYSTYDVYLE